MHGQRNKLTGNHREAARGKEMRRSLTQNAIERNKVTGYGNGNRKEVDKGMEMKRSLTHTLSIQRRRKIAEKSADRLNFIKGHYRSLSSPTSFGSFDSPVSTPFDSSPRTPFQLLEDHHLEDYSLSPDETPRSITSRPDPSSQENSTTEDNADRAREASADTNLLEGSCESTSCPEPSPQKQTDSCTLASDQGTRGSFSLIIAVLVVLFAIHCLEKTY